MLFLPCTGLLSGLVASLRHGMVGCRGTPCGACHARPSWAAPLLLLPPGTYCRVAGLWAVSLHERSEQMPPEAPPSLPSGPPVAPHLPTVSYRVPTRTCPRRPPMAALHHCHAPAPWDRARLILLGPHPNSMTPFAGLTPLGPRFNAIGRRPLSPA